MRKAKLFVSILMLVILGSTAAFYNATAEENVAKLKIVVLDAGHGGKDPGTLGDNSKEKDVALKITLALGKLIEKNQPDVKVIYTRKTDVFIPLNERANIANTAGADLFISIHCNANANKSASGFETYVMGNNTEGANLDVAKRENAVILKEDNYSSNYDGFDPNSPQSHIIFSMFQNAFLDQSITLAARVQEQFNRSLTFRDRGVKKAGFLVLYKTYMPSVLIETGFLSNNDEEKYLTSEEHQKKYAQAIYEAFDNYKKQVEVVVPEDKTIDKTGVKFRVQLAASPQDIVINEAPYTALTDIEKTRIDNKYKVFYGNYNTLNLAIVAQNIAREKGFPDAFVVAFHNNKIITIERAKALLKDGK